MSGPGEQMQDPMISTITGPLNSGSLNGSMNSNGIAPPMPLDEKQFSQMTQLIDSSVPPSERLVLQYLTWAHCDLQVALDYTDSW